MDLHLHVCQKFKITLGVHNYNTRNRDRLQIPLCRTGVGQHAFIFRGQKLWNSHPDEFQSITNLDVFKVKKKKTFFKGIFGQLSFRYLTLLIKLKSLSRRLIKFYFCKLFELSSLRMVEEEVWPL